MKNYELIGVLMVPVEIANLVFAERFIGVKAIRANRDPRDRPPPSALAGRIWFTLLVMIVTYPAVLLCLPETRIFGGGMMSLWVIGSLLRRSAGFKYALVILTLEGGLRIGVVVHMLLYADMYRR